MIVSWFSGGVTSAVATKIALQLYDDVRPVFIETGSHHPDMQRFIIDCESWFGRKIMVIRDERYKDHIDVLVKESYVNGPNGAPCSRSLKKRVRQKFQRENKVDAQVFGFEFEKKEINRALRFQEQNPEVSPLFPLIDRKLTKAGCMEMIRRAGIELPMMYKLGYSNNNCIGCVKGGKGYWNKIRNDFPDTFDRMAKAEREIGGSCIKGTFLDELDPLSGRDEPGVMPECDLFCEVEFADLEHPKLKEII